MEYDSELSLLSSKFTQDYPPDVYPEMMRNLPTIVREATDYVDTYINHVNGTAPIHPRAFARKYQYSTLPYFHDIMGI